MSNEPDPYFMMWLPKSPDDFEEAQRIIKLTCHPFAVPRDYDDMCERAHAHIRQFEEEIESKREQLEAEGVDIDSIAKPEIIWMSTKALLERIQNMRLPLTAKAVSMALDAAYQESKEIN